MSDNKYQGPKATPYTTEDCDAVQVLETRHLFDGFISIHLHRMRIKRFDGSWSGEFSHEMYYRGDGVAILPYDPIHDEVVLIRQFRPGAHFALQEPFPFQLISGIVATNETVEESARREANEEAGCDIAQTESLMTYLANPGGSPELTTIFVGRVSSRSIGGIHGLASEHEDIKAEVLKADDAIALLNSGKVRIGSALIALLWFATNRSALRERWMGTEQ